jgi:hypothetical protein
MDSQYRTMRDRLLHNINNTMEGEGGIRVLGTESFSIIMGHDDQRKEMMIDGTATWLGENSDLDYKQEKQCNSFV